MEHFQNVSIGKFWYVAKTFYYVSKWHKTVHFAFTLIL